MTDFVNELNVSSPNRCDYKRDNRQILSLELET